MAFGGRGSNACLFGCALGILAAMDVVVVATVYPVGGDGTWTVPGSSNSNIDYTTWAVSETFAFGDELVFKYDNSSHNVYLVNSTAYAACDIISEPILQWTSGNDVILLNLGYNEYSFVCGFPSHCTLGQKFHIAVTSFTPAPIGSTNPSPPSAIDEGGSALLEAAGTVKLLVSSLLICLLLAF